jgi:hypothetical protein
MISRKITKITNVGVPEHKIKIEGCVLQDLFDWLTSQARDVSESYIPRVPFIRRRNGKFSVGADVLKQVICSIKIRRAPRTRHDNIDFKPIIARASEIKPLSVAVVDKGYDSEENHVLVRERLKAYSIASIQVPHGKVDSK